MDSNVADIVLRNPHSKSYLKTDRENKREHAGEATTAVEAPFKNRNVG